jgi:hypothetical protein
MGEINFISDDLEESASGKKPPKKGAKPEKWTPANDDAVADDGEDLVLAKNEDTTKEKIEKSRQEVLDVIDRKKAKAEDKSIKEPESKMASWFGRLAGKKTEAPVAGAGLAGSSTAKPSSSPGIGNDSPMIFNNNTWNNVGVLETNLIDKSDYSFFDTGKKARALSLGVLGSVLIVSLLYFGLLYWEYTELSRLKDEKVAIVDLESEVKKLELETKEAKQFQAKLNFATQIIDKHVYLTNFFDFLESKTLSNVFYSGEIELEFGTPHSFTTRTDDYESMKNQLMVLAEDKRIKSLSLGEVGSYGKKSEEPTPPIDPNATSTIVSLPVVSKGVEFVMDFELEKDIYYNMATTSEEVIDMDQIDPAAIESR